MTFKEQAADIVSAAAIHAHNVPGPAVAQIDADVLREEIEKALKAEREACAKAVHKVMFEMCGWPIGMRSLPEEAVRARSQLVT